MKTWLQAKNAGFKSRTTFSKHLQKLCRLGRVLKEGGQYRLNVAYGGPSSKYLNVLRIEAGYGRSNPYRLRWVVEDRFPDFVGEALHVLFINYVTMLRELVKAPNRKLAEEIIDLFWKVDTGHLDAMSNSVWQYRTSIDPKKLEKLMELEVKLRPKIPSSGSQQDKKS